jgi:hypothetical protein
MGFMLDARARLAIELALTAHDADPSQRRRQDEEARQLGLRGAEIDAARHGRSFDAQISIALALATAGSDEERQRQRAKAIEAGIGGSACREIEAFASLFSAA